MSQYILEELAVALGCSLEKVPDTLQQCVRELRRKAADLAWDEAYSCRDFGHRRIKELKETYLKKYE